MNLNKTLSVLFVLLLAPFITLNAQQSSGGAGGSGGSGGNTQVAPTKPTVSAGGGGVSNPVSSSVPIILDRLEVVVEKLGTWITLVGTFPEAPTGVTISRDGEWVSFHQNWSIKNGIKFQVDSSLPSGTYEVSITQGDNSNKQPLSFSITEIGEVAPVPTVGGKILPEPNNDRRPVINSFEPKLIAGQRSIITGERFTPPIMVRLEGNSGDIMWARRIVPVSESTLEFVTPGTHFGSLVLVVDNGHGVSRVAVTVESPPSPQPIVLGVKFAELMGGGFVGFVKLDKPLGPTDFLIVGKRVENELAPQELILILSQSPDPDWLAGLEEEMREFEMAGGILHRPGGYYGGSVVAFMVPQPFATIGLEWLNTGRRDENGYVVGPGGENNEIKHNVWADVE